VLHCPALNDLGLRTWLALPLLFVCSAAGFAALVAVTVDATVIDLSPPLLLGSAAALSVLTGSHVAWPSPAHRRALMAIYPGSMVACALSLDRALLPTTSTLAIGLASALVLTAVLIRNQSRAPCPTGVGVREHSAHE
jgi:hypothetical protein